MSKTYFYSLAASVYITPHMSYWCAITLSTICLAFAFHEAWKEDKQ